MASSPYLSTASLFQAYDNLSRNKTAHPSAITGLIANMEGALKVDGPSRPKYTSLLFGYFVGYLLYH